MPFCPSRAFSPPTSFWHFWSPFLFHTSAFLHLSSHSSFSEAAQLFNNLFYSPFLRFCICQQHFLPFLSLGQVRKPHPFNLAVHLSSSLKHALHNKKEKFNLAHLYYCRGNQCGGIQKMSSLHCSIHTQHIIFQQPGPSGTYLTEPYNLNLK